MLEEKLSYRQRYSQEGKGELRGWKSSTELFETQKQVQVLRDSHQAEIQHKKPLN